MIEAPAVPNDSRRSESVARGRQRTPLLLPALIVLLAFAVLLNAGIGAVRIAPIQAIAILLDHLGITLDVTVTPQQDAVLWNIRLPRIVLAALVGGALALAGAVLQGVFRNPLADPSLIGVSSGAAVGAVAAIVVGFTLFGLASLPVAAFAGGVHSCMGAHLARLEVKACVDVFLKRIPDFQLKPGTKIEYWPGGVVGPKSVPLVW